MQKYKKANSIEEAIYRFRAHLMELTGEENAVVKIGLHPKVFDRLSYESYDKLKYLCAYKDGEFTVLGIQIRPLLPEKF